MNIIDVMQASNGVTDQVNQITAVLFLPFEAEGWTYSDFVKYITDLGLNIANFYVTDSKMLNCFYIDYNNGVYIDCTIFDKGMLEFMQLPERISACKDKIKELLDNHNYHAFYLCVPTSLKVYDFHRRFKDIDTTQVAEVWLDIYTDFDFGFDIWDKEVLEYVFQFCQPTEITEPLTIYRGIGTQSTPIESSYSWTADLNVALWFATRFGYGQAIATATVYPEDILFYTDDRNEKEVIVKYSSLKEVKTLDIESCKQDTLQSLVDKHYPYYNGYGRFIDEDWFTGDAHDFSHTARVLFYSLMLADTLKIKDIEDIQILAYCSIYHDIGRCHDGVDENHGFESVNRLEEEDDLDVLPFDLSYENLLIAKDIIRYHCINDEVGIAKITENTLITAKDKAVHLYKIFKDADCLDRVRFNNFRYEFDIEYLRFAESKRLLFIVDGLFKGKIEKML